MTVIKRPKKKIQEEPVIDPNKEKDVAKTQRIIDKKEVVTGKAQRISKVVSLHFSVGDEDRVNTIEQMVKSIMALLKPAPYGKPGLHVTQTGAYYILDGVVCLPADYDSQKQQMLDGHFPPPWAGGPSPQHKATKTDISGGKYDRPTLSAAEFDKKYKGKGNPSVIKPVNDDELQEIEWDESTVDDIDAAKEVANKAVENARRTLKIKKVAKPQPKRVVRRAK